MAQLLDGSYEQQREVMRTAIAEPGDSGRLTSSLGSRCGALAELKILLESA